jgi:hypothetical protein
MLNRLVLTGSSKPRKEALNQIPNVEEVSNFNGGDENQFLALPLLIAIGKIREAIKLQVDVERKFRNGAGLIAADTMTSLPSDQNKLVTQGKSTGIEQVQKTFELMRDTGKDQYGVESGSILIDLDNEKEAVMGVLLTLRKSMIHYLASEKGMEEYLILGKEALKTDRDDWVKNISGGILLEALLKMGAVQSINGFELDNLSDYKKFELVRLAYYIVRIGFSPKILNSINDQAFEAILAWSWLNEQVVAMLGSRYKKFMI